MGYFWGFLGIFGVFGQKTSIFGVFGVKNGHFWGFLGGGQKKHMGFNADKKTLSLLRGIKMAKKRLFCKTLAIPTFCDFPKPFKRHGFGFFKKCGEGFFGPFLGFFAVFGGGGVKNSVFWSFLGFLGIFGVFGHFCGFWGFFTGGGQKRPFFGGSKRGVKNGQFWGSKKGVF